MKSGVVVSEAFRGWAGKTPKRFAALALILHCIETEISGGGLIDVPISGEIARKARTIVDDLSCRTGIGFTTTSTAAPGIPHRRCRRLSPTLERAPAHHLARITRGTSLMQIPNSPPTIAWKSSTTSSPPAGSSPWSGTSIIDRGGLSRFGRALRETAFRSKLMARRHPIPFSWKRGVTVVNLLPSLPRVHERKSCGNPSSFLGNNLHPSTPISGQQRRQTKRRCIRCRCCHARGDH